MIGNLLQTIEAVSTVLVVVAAGIFTIRANAATTWRENYEAEREARVLAEADAKAQREEKHQRINELQAERLKTDLTPVLQFAARHEQEVARQTEEIERMIRDAMTKVLDQLEAERAADE